jgi:hypothetical protein
VVTGITAPTGLVFAPNLAVLRSVTETSSCWSIHRSELTLGVNIAGVEAELNVEAGERRY